ncbi:MAG TPA: carboxypeptidase-like regulatory domain-containing protein [Mucilaginibacter sp.]
MAQSGTISGTVTSADSKKPLPRASVFLSNSAIGSATNEEGKYILSGVRPGQYTLVVSILGYEQYSKTILVGREPMKLDIELAQKPLMLREVVISSNADWKKNYEAFRKEFIGTDENAKYCEIINPHILNITYNPSKELLHADADQFLVVENKALGYRVKFLLNDFKIDKIANLISREGQQVFEELPGSEAQKKRWHEKREEAYYGSSMHFYRSLYTDKLAEEGFQIYRLSRYLNPERPDEEVIRRKIKYFTEIRRADSANYWIGLANKSKYYRDNLIKPPLFTFEILNRDEQQGLFDIHFINYLYIVYTKKTDDIYNKDLYRPLDMPNYAVSVVTLTAPYAVFDMNGIIIANPPIYEGAWARDRLSDMLPVDYVPDVK